MPKEFLPAKHKVMIFIAWLAAASFAKGQFLDHFDGTVLSRDPSAAKGWTFYTGDGSAVMNFSHSGKGYASITVDATKDKRGVWWALIRRRVSEDMDLRRLIDPHYELRIEARIRVSDAPRRINLHLNTQRTSDFHSHLMEFDIPDTVNWHTISMTTRRFDAVPGDSVYGQLALMDWGLERYRVDLDYIRADIVNVDSAGPDKGVQVPYHPPVPDPVTFTHHIPVAQDGMIDLEYPDLRFNNWFSRDETGRTILLTVNGTQFVILRWDLSAFAAKRVAGSGLLELTTYALERSQDDVKDFGMVRITEIIGGDPEWNQKEVSYSRLCRRQPLNSVFNAQMIIDIDVTEGRGGTTLATISNPVLQRLVDGKTLGLAIRPLGAVHASFYAMENQGGRFSAKLHFNCGPNSLDPIQKQP
jgi:hypothetical protein